MFPLLIAFGGQDNFRMSLYGWEQIEAPVDAAVAQYQPDFIASDGPEFGAIVAFALDDPDLRALTFRPNQLNYWWNREEFRGKSAIVVLDQTRATARLPEPVRDRSRRSAKCPSCGSGTSSTASSSTTPKATSRSG